MSKKELHPKDYAPVVFSDEAAGFSFLTKSTATSEETIKWEDGNEYPTVGISFGLSAIYELLKDNNLFNDRSQTDIYIIPMNTEIESLNLANEIRDLGFKVEIEMTRKKFKKSMDYANKEKIPYIIVLGEDEVKRKSFNIKNMNTGEQTEIKFDNLDKIEEIV